MNKKWVLCLGLFLGMWMLPLAASHALPGFHIIQVDHHHGDDEDGGWGWWGGDHDHGGHEHHHHGHHD